MTTRVFRRHWFGYGTDPLPAGTEALDEPFSASPSWFLRIECDRCGGRAGNAGLLTASRSRAQGG